MQFSSPSLRRPARATDDWERKRPRAAVGEDAAAWDTTINSNDFPSTLNFILFLSSLNSIAVFIGMMACSEGFGWLQSTTSSERQMIPSFG
jgi:hypothetical protein